MPKYEVPQVEVFTETTASCEDEFTERIWANMVTRIEAAGLDLQDAVRAVNRHIRPNGSVYWVHIVTVMPKPALTLAKTE